MPPSFAIYNAIREQHKKFAKRMEDEGLKPIGMLGGREREPEIIGFSVEQAANRRQLRLTVKFPTAGLPTEGQIVLDLEADGGPANGTSVSCLIKGEKGPERFAGQIDYRFGGSRWNIEWEGVE